MSSLPWWFWVFIVGPMFVVMFSFLPLGKWLSRKDGEDDAG